MPTPICHSLHPKPFPSLLAVFVFLEIPHQDDVDFVTQSLVRSNHRGPACGLHPQFSKRSATCGPRSCFLVTVMAPEMWLHQGVTRAVGKSNSLHSQLAEGHSFLKPRFPRLCMTLTSQSSKVFEGVGADTVVHQFDTNGHAKMLIIPMRVLVRDTKRTPRTQTRSIKYCCAVQHWS